MSDGRDPERVLIENLLSSLDRAAEREERLVRRLEEVVSIVSKVDRNSADVKEIHGDLYGKGGLMSRVEIIERAPVVEVAQKKDEKDSGLFLSTRSVVSIGLFLVGSALTALWHIVDWFIRLAHRMSP